MTNIGKKWRGNAAERDVWSYQNPELAECCICECSMLPVLEHQEIRGTGFRGKRQTWGYCDKCWADKLIIDRTDLDPGALVAFLRHDVKPDLPSPGLQYRLRCQFNMPAY